MRTAALILGMTAGIFGILTALFQTSIAVLLRITDLPSADRVMPLALVAIAASLVGLVGAVLAPTKPNSSAVLLVVAADAFALATWKLALITTPLFAVAAVLAFLGGAERPKARLRQG